MQEIRVECYAGYKADERPVRFTLGEHAYEVTSVEDQWQAPGVSWFRVRANDGNLYILRHDEGPDAWSLEAFRSDHAP
jgi:hypothetical protein